jgi:hypothetical protein
MKIMSLLSGIIITLVITHAAYGESLNLRDPIGVFSIDESGCWISNAKYRERCSQGAAIYVGDIIDSSRPIESLKINWAFEKRTTLIRLSNPRKYRVDFGKSKEENALTFLVSELYSWLKKIESGTTTPVYSRGDFVVRRLQPGANITVVLGQRITFEWCGTSGKVFKIKDGIGKTIYEQEVNGKTKLAFSPEDAGMSYPGTYSWEIIGIDIIQHNVMNVLSPDMTKEVTTNLKSIDQKDIAPQAVILQKAMYLQLITDMHPGEINLDWLSYQLLKEHIDELVSYDRYLLEFLIQKTKLTSCN